ncbi:hypothetical protein Ahy_A08g038723 [Arachis hypogaea]|uniref:Aminotransferase-like plant mobile domain-containing protein n=1 Tax=Arachis hypogaea TaxID=3818 RepID=A0A445BU77_ARAHY|nr:hypothetical protein Ahy_A08g038723 [Arachis hypogaea]
MSPTWLVPFSYYSLGSSGGSRRSGRMDLTTFFSWAIYLSISDGKEQRIIQFRLVLDRLGGQDCSNARFGYPFQIVWEPYAALDVLVVVHLKILTEEHIDRVVPQLGDVQHVPEPGLNIDWLHAKDNKGGDKYDICIWGNRVDSILNIQRMVDSGPSAEYLDWWYRVAHRVLSPNAIFADPRQVEIPVDAFHRRSSQAPARI